MSKDYDGLFVCTECQSDQSLDPYNNLWVQSGNTPPCRYCGGVVVFLDNPDGRNDAIRQSNRQRGIS